MNALPEFAAPPLVEVALGIQFQPLLGLRPVELGPLRDDWRSAYPLVQEVPPLPSQIEADEHGQPVFHFAIGASPQPRLWFTDESQAGLVQLQQDRLIVNWRQTSGETQYPRYPTVRSQFEARLGELASFLADRHLGVIEILQVEVTYINAIDPDASGALGLDRVLRNWHQVTGHHLGEPEEARAAMVFEVPHLGISPVRMYVAADPARRPDGSPAIFLTITVRGAPTDTSAEQALEFMDGAHKHVVQGFADLTPESMHNEWRRLS